MAQAERFIILTMVLVYAFWIIIVIFGFVYGGFIGGLLCIAAPFILWGILSGIGASLDERDAEKQFTRVAEGAGYTYWQIRRIKATKKQSETWDECTAQLLRINKHDMQ